MNRTCVAVSLLLLLGSQRLEAQGTASARVAALAHLISRAELKLPASGVDLVAEADLHRTAKLSRDDQDAEDRESVAVAALLGTSSRLRRASEVWECVMRSCDRSVGRVALFVGSPVATSGTWRVTVETNEVSQTPGGKVSGGSLYKVEVRPSGKGWEAVRTVVRVAGTSAPKP